MVVSVVVEGVVVDSVVVSVAVAAAVVVLVVVGWCWLLWVYGVLWWGKWLRWWLLCVALCCGGFVWGCIVVESCCS